MSDKENEENVSEERNENVKVDRAPWLAPYRFGKGNQAAVGHTYIPKSKAVHLVLSTLCDVGMKAAQNIARALDSKDEELAFNASKFVITMLHKAGKLERELTASEEEQINAELQSLSDQELTALASMRGKSTSSEATPSEASSMTVSVETSSDEH